MKKEYLVRAPLFLPFVEKRKEPGSTVTREELEKAQQTDEDVKTLIENGALGEDVDGEIHPDHVPVPPGTPSVALMVEQAKALVELHGEDNVPKELKALAKLDYQHVSGGTDGARGGERGNS